MTLPCTVRSRKTVRIGPLALRSCWPPGAVPVPALVPPGFPAGWGAGAADEAEPPPKCASCPRTARPTASAKIAPMMIGTALTPKVPPPLGRLAGGRDGRAGWDGRLDTREGGFRGEACCRAVGRDGGAGRRVAAGLEEVIFWRPCGAGRRAGGRVGGAGMSGGR